MLGIKLPHRLADAGCVDTSDRRGRRIWRALTQRREHQLIDFVFGFFGLLLIVGWIASFSPVLAVTALIGGSVAYLINLWHQQKAEKRQLDAPEEPAGIGASAALNFLAAKLSKAPEIPLTDSVRLNPDEVAGLIAEVRAAARSTSEENRAEQLRQVVLSGRPVPFTGQVRIDRGRALGVIEELRSGLGFA